MPASSKTQNKMRFIFVTVLLDAIGLGLLIPVMPDILRRFSTDPTFVSEHYGYFIGIYALMQFLASPVLGSLSDRYGRRPILLVSLLFAGLDYVFMAYAPTLTLLYLGRIISGLTGASMTVASSYLADVSDDSNRGANFGLMGAGWGVGFILGPMIGGSVAGLGPKAPFLVAAALNLLNFAYGLFVLPESLDKAHRRDIKLKNLNPLASIFKVLKPSPISILVWIYFFLFLAGQVHPVNWTLYTQTKFGWSTFQVGLSLSFVGIVMAIGNVVLTRKLIPALGEPRALTFGLCVNAASFLLFGIATQGWMMYAILVFFAFACVTVPALQSMMVKHIPANQQGEFQGSLVSLGSLSCVVAPVIFTALFTHFTKPGMAHPFSGAAYAGAAVICLGTLGLWLYQEPAEINSIAKAKNPAK